MKESRVSFDPQDCLQEHKVMVKQGPQNGEGNDSTKKYCHNGLKIREKVLLIQMRGFHSKHAHFIKIRPPTPNAHVQD